MKDFPPWWTTRDIWTEMCVKWRDEKWKKKSTVASANRSVGSAPGGRALGTYRGGPKSQGHYVMEQVIYLIILSIRILITAQIN